MRQSGPRLSATVHHGLAQQQRVHTSSFSYSGAATPRSTTVFVNGRSITNDDGALEAETAGSLHKTGAATRRSSKVCVVCWEAPISAVAVPCGHAVACWECLTKVRELRQSGCPLCRGQIREISRLQQPLSGTVPLRRRRDHDSDSLGMSASSRDRKPQT